MAPHWFADPQYHQQGWLALLLHFKVDLVPVVSIADQTNQQDYRVQGLRPDRRTDHPNGHQSLYLKDFRQNDLPIRVCRSAVSNAQPTIGRRTAFPRGPTGPPVVLMKARCAHSHASARPLHPHQLAVRRRHARTDHLPSALRRIAPASHRLRSPLPPPKGRPTMVRAHLAAGKATARRALARCTPSTKTASAS